MCSKIKISKSTDSFSESVDKLKKALSECDSVLIGAGAGLSTAAGYEYGGKRFEDNFPDFIEKYGIEDMYSGGFYPFRTDEEKWAWWSREIFLNRYVDMPKNTYFNLFDIVKDKDYFVLTTNVDHCFRKAGFDKQRLFYTQGDYGLFQCSKPCCNETFDNEELIMEMIRQQKDMKIPSELVPRCPHCGRPMTTNLRADDKFVEDEGWYLASERYSDFVTAKKDGKILFLELGVGYNTPSIIKFPFWRYTAANPDAVYACINFGQAYAPDDIMGQSVCIDADINDVLEQLKG